MDAKRENVEACILEPDDFSDDEEDGESSEIFRPGDDITYFLERIRIGNCPIKGRKL